MVSRNAPVLAGDRMTKGRQKWGEVQMQRNVSWEGSKAGGVFKAPGF